MTEHEAAQVLAEADAELIPVVRGQVSEVKRILRDCLERDLPVAVASPPEAAARGQVALLVREQDVPAVAALLHREWKDLVDREGVDTGGARIGVEAGEGEEPPCPACGTAAPLVEGACSECGLHLE